MGKRKRCNEVKAENGGPKPVKDKGRDGIAESSVGKDNSSTRNKKKVTAAPANEENLVNGESKAADSSRRSSRRAVVMAGNGGKHATGKAAASESIEGTRFQGGEVGAKKIFTWNSAQEIIALAELVKSTTVDAGQPSDTSNIDWEQLAATVGQRLDCDLTRTQIYEKARRLKERYLRMCKLVGEARPNSFKNEDEEKVYTLSRQIWGSSQAIRPQPEEENDLLSGNSEKKLCDTDNICKGGSLPDAPEVEIPGVTLKKKCATKAQLKEDTMSPSEAKQETTVAHTQANPDPNLESHLKVHAIEGDTQKTLEIFHVEQQALLKQLEKSCATVLQDMQEKFLSMINNTVRGSPLSWMGGRGCVPSFDFIAQAPLSWDKLVDKCLSTSTNKPMAFENLCEQWQQHRLQELKLTSKKLQLMLEDCKTEQEKLERQVSKS